MHRGRSRVENVLDVDAASEQRVGYQRAVASPPDRLCTHERGAAPRTKLHDLIQSPGKRLGLHVVGVAAKARVTPCDVDRVGGRLAVAAECADPAIADAALRQALLQRFLAVLRVAPRA